MSKKNQSDAWQRRGELAVEQHRSFKIETRAMDDDKRSVEIAFSSEKPVERDFGSEVLDHTPQSVRLDRLMGGAAVLVNHDTNDQVGVVSSARIDDDGIGRAVVRFSRSQRGEEIYQDVKDGIRQLVSVGYRIHGYDISEREGLSDLVRVTDWEPYELSMVAIPADSSVGVGRSVAKNPKLTAEPQGETAMKNEKQGDTETTVEPVVQARSEQAPAFNAEGERTRIRNEENKRRGDIDALADKYELDDLGRQAISEGWDVPKFHEKALEEIGKQNSAVRAQSDHDGEVDLSRKDRSNFSLMRLMAALSNPNDRTAQDKARFELEVSAEAQRGFGNEFSCRGEFIPSSLIGGQRVLSAGTATDGAELVATDLLSSSYIEVLRNASAVMQAGATMIPGLVGNVDIPRQTSAAAATWISAEDGDATVGEAQFDQVSMTPKDLACYTEVTRRLLLQSTPAIEGIVRNDLIVAQALGIDLAVLYGSGAAGQPTGIVNQTGVNNFNLVAADPTYAEIVRMIKEVLADNALTGTPSFIMEANGWEALSTTSKQGAGVEGNFILGDTDRIKGYGYTVSNQVTAEDYFFGDWSQVLVGEWGGLELNVDPYTHSLKGKVRYVMFKTTDVAVRHGEHFTFVNDGV